MALLTPMTLAQAQSIGASFGLQLTALNPIVHGSVNSNFSAELTGGGRVFLRVCEESDAPAVRRQNRLLEHLVAHGVPTPAPLLRSDNGDSIAEHCGKPVAVFPFIAGHSVCQQRCDEARLRQVGAALGSIHETGRSFVDPPAERFGQAQLNARLQALYRAPLDEELRAACRLLGDRLVELSRRPAAAEPTVIHGDVFRDNVLWRDGEQVRLAAVLDFESASRGSPAFDLMVTMLAWCFGETLSQPLARALLEGYRERAPLSPELVAQCYDEARAAAVRFAVTRITDYELRPQGVVAYKDYRRFIRRLHAVEAIGAGDFASWLLG